MEKMSEIRKGQISLQILRYFIRKKGIHLNQDFKLEVVNEAMNIDGITGEEALIFTKELICELIEENFR